MVTEPEPEDDILEGEPAPAPETQAVAGTPPRIWTVFVVYVVAFVATVLVQIVAVIGLIAWHAA